MFRALFAEGAFSAAFIPMFNRKVGEADDVNAGLRFAEQTLAVLLPVLAAVHIVMLIFAWPVTWGLSGGFKNRRTSSSPSRSLCRGSPFPI